jgi:hypothetical protein
LDFEVLDLDNKVCVDFKPKKGHYMRESNKVALHYTVANIQLCQAPFVVRGIGEDSCCHFDLSLWIAGRQGQAAGKWQAAAGGGAGVGVVDRQRCLRRKRSHRRSYVRGLPEKRNALTQRRLLRAY